MESGPTPGPHGQPIDASSAALLRRASVPTIIDVAGATRGTATSAPRHHRVGTVPTGRSRGLVRGFGVVAASTGVFALSVRLVAAAWDAKPFIVCATVLMLGFLAVIVAAVYGLYRAAERERRAVERARAQRQAAVPFRRRAGTVVVTDDGTLWFVPQGPSSARQGWDQW